ncbi:MAG TPA: aromatic aminobenezylarsenical efflux permease ArsG family transporter [Planctomycetota bacterium]|nr:aromatic aminobenezylarsenical efflux permease ArsG family transporter [Planctomycetota bacterium]
MTWYVVASALWLGVLTSISPCPLASNIAAISFIGRHMGNHRRVLLSGVLYTLGRVLAYVAVGAIILGAFQWLALSGGDVSRFLQRYMSLVLGPALILIGMILLEMLGFSFSLNLASQGAQQKAGRGGVFWTTGLGFLFALSFCPVSAGLYFGALLPLSAKHGSQFVLPIIFGIGTALPVLVFAFLIAFASEYVGKAFNRVSQIEKWVRGITGAVFILAGIYYSLAHIYGISLLG